MGEQQGLLFIDPVFRFPDIQLELPSKKKFKEIPCRVRVVAPASVPYSGGLATAPCTITITNTSSQVRPSLHNSLLFRHHSVIASFGRAFWA